MTALVNCAAFTDVSSAENDPLHAYSINSFAPKILTQICEEAAVPIVHFSTDYVFDGQNEVLPSVERDPHPINEYGKSKLHGEKPVLSYELGTVIRTSWLYSSQNYTFPNKILGKIKRGEELSVVDDEFGCPTWVDDLAKFTLHVLSESRFGLLHGNSEGRVSRFDFAQEIVRTFNNDFLNLRPVSTSEFRDPVTRPKFGGLKNSLVRGWHWPNWIDSFHDSLHSFDNALE